MTDPRISTHLAPFSPGADRFANQAISQKSDIEARIRQAAQCIPGLNGIELNFRSSISEQTLEPFNRCWKKWVCMCKYVDECLGTRLLERWLAFQCG
jgi:hypothetical protein